ncbi:MAG: PTS glucose transporter subunit IIA [Clostridia bacterium]|nr:PTS glucose transporter subunit IIA [Clostridia bacterium]
MFKFLKKEHYLASIASGNIMDITLVPDEVFSKKILGAGFAVMPTDGNFFSPATGTVSEVSKTLHAYCITSDDGLEILVHIGLDTVKLGGKFFTPKVKTGDRIQKGAPLVIADINGIKESGYNPISMVVVTNSDKLSSCNPVETTSTKPGDKAFIYKI